MRGLKKNRMGRGHQTHKQTDGHRDSMKESAKGRFFEKNPKPFRARFENTMGNPILIFFFWLKRSEFIF